MDSNHRRLTSADLQSAPFSHSGIYPFIVSLARDGCMRSGRDFDKGKDSAGMEKLGRLA